MNTNMKRTIMSLVACVALCFAASAQKQWHQDLINTASASPSADVNAVVNRDNMTGRIKNARYRIYLQPASAENVRRRLITHQKEAGMYSLDSKKLVMSFDDAGVRTTTACRSKGASVCCSSRSSHRRARLPTTLSRFRSIHLTSP